jgi:putative MATE family efflux protein
MDRAIAVVALPAMISFLCQILFELVDAYWLDRLHWEGIFASIGAASFVEWSLFALMLCVTAGITSLISQAVGARAESTWKILAWEGIIMALIMSAGITVTMEATHPWIFRTVGLEGRVLQDACTYFRVLNFGYVVMFLFNLTGIVFNAHGDTRSSMAVGLAAFLMNAVLDPFLILGWGPFPAMGIQGAALASVISQGCGTLLRFMLLVRRGYCPALPGRESIALPHCRNILKIGIPQAATHWVFSMVYPVLSHFLTVLGNVPALGALAICHRMEGVPYFAAVSLSITASALAGQYHGAGNGARGIQAVNRTVFHGTLFLGFCSVLFLTIPETLISIITSSPEIQKEGASYLRIIGTLELFMGWEVIFEGGFTGFGLTRYPMYFSIPLTLARIPLAWFLAFRAGWGVSGIWWAISLTTFFKGILIGGIFRYGSWRKSVLISSQG